MNIKKALETVRKFNQFETKTFHKDTEKEFKRVCIIEDIDKDTHGKLVDLVYRDTTADDYTYSWIRQAFGAIEEELLNLREDDEIDSLNDLELTEAIDGIVDVYTHNITTWLGSNVNRVYYLTGAIEQGTTDGYNALALAQYLEISEMFDKVVSFLNEEILN